MRSAPKRVKQVETNSSRAFLSKVLFMKPEFGRQRLVEEDATGGRVDQLAADPDADRRVQIDDLVGVGDPDLVGADEDLARALARRRGFVM